MIHAMQDPPLFAGNFYINDKPTGAMVGQQPFGGAELRHERQGRQLPQPQRWVSPRTIKETLIPPTDFQDPLWINEKKCLSHVG